MAQAFLCKLKLNYYWVSENLCLYICKDNCISIHSHWLNNHYTPTTGKVKWGYTGFTPMSVRPSFRPSVNMVSGTFWKNYWLNSFHTRHLPLWGEYLDPYFFFRVPSLIFGPLLAIYLAENEVSGTLKKKLLAQFISYLAFTLMGWVSWPLYIFLFLASFSALWWPNIWPKMGFPELFEKCIGSINFIPGIYLYGVSLLTPVHFRVPGLIFGPLVAKYLAENGVSGIFLKSYWFHSLHT